MWIFFLLSLATYNWRRLIKKKKNPPPPLPVSIFICVFLCLFLFRSLALCFSLPRSVYSVFLFFSCSAFLSLCLLYFYLAKSVSSLRAYNIICLSFDIFFNYSNVYVCFIVDSWPSEYLLFQTSLPPLSLKSHSRENQPPPLTFYLSHRLSVKR